MRGASTVLAVERVAGRRPLSLSFATSAVIQALNVITGVLLARSLGPKGRGELAAVMLWPGVLAALGSLGVVEALTFHAARRSTKMGTLVGSGTALCLLQSAVLVMAGLVVVPLALHHYGQDTLAAAHLFLAYIPLYLLAMYLTAALNGAGRYSRFHAMRLLVIAVSAAGLVLLALLGQLTVMRAAVVFLIAHLVTVAAAALCLRIPAADLNVERGVAGRLLAFGVKSHGAGVASMLNERLDQLLISVFLTPIDLGLYVIAVTLTSLTGLVGSSTSLVALPAIARLTPGAERDRAARRLVSAALLGSVAVTVPLLILLPVLVTTFFGDAYRAAAEPARLLLVAAVALSVNRVLSALLRAIGRPLDVGVGELLALGVTAIGLAVLLPSAGLVGAAVTSLLAYVAAMGWLARRAATALGVPVRTLFLPEVR